MNSNAQLADPITTNREAKGEGGELVEADLGCFDYDLWQESLNDYELRTWAD